MNRALQWKLIAGFILVFVAGGISGAFLGGLYAQHPFLAFHRPELIGARMKERLRAELNLKFRRSSIRQPYNSEKSGETPRGAFMKRSLTPTGRWLLISQTNNAKNCSKSKSDTGAGAIVAFTNLPPNRRRRLRSFHAAVARAGLSASISHAVAAKCPLRTADTTAVTILPRQVRTAVPFQKRFAHARRLRLDSRTDRAVLACSNHHRAVD